MIEKNVPTIAKNDWPIICLADLKLGEALVLLAEPVDLVALPAERPSTAGCRRR